MAKSQKSSVESSFQIPESVRLNHQREYLQSINTVAPEVGEAIRELNPQCLTLLGELSAFRSEPGMEEFHHLICNIFESCIWKETRNANRFFLFSHLSKNNTDIKQIDEKEEKFNVHTNLTFTLRILFFY